MYNKQWISVRRKTWNSFAHERNHLFPRISYPQLAGFLRISLMSDDKEVRTWDSEAHLLSTFSCELRTCMLKDFVPFGTEIKMGYMYIYIPKSIQIGGSKSVFTRVLWTLILHSTLNCSTKIHIISQFGHKIVVHKLKLKLWRSKAKEALVRVVTHTDLGTELLSSCEILQRQALLHSVVGTSLWLLITTKICVHRDISVCGCTHTQSFQWVPPPHRECGLIGIAVASSLPNLMILFWPHRLPQSHFRPPIFLHPKSYKHMYAQNYLALWFNFLNYY